jgi:hypothetical protein
MQAPPRVDDAVLSQKAQKPQLSNIPEQFEGIRNFNTPKHTMPTSVMHSFIRKESSAWRTASLTLNSMGVVRLARALHRGHKLRLQMSQPRLLEALRCELSVLSVALAARAFACGGERGVRGH